MNHRQWKKSLTQEQRDIIKEFSRCQECGKKLNQKDKYHMKYGTCNATCYLHMVGMSWSDFY